MVVLAFPLHYFPNQLDFLRVCKAALGHEEKSVVPGTAGLAVQLQDESGKHQVRRQAGRGEGAPQGSPERGVFTVN